ncbi:MAG: AMP-binding protein, partial [Acidimicrobiales bacterium]
MHAFRPDAPSRIDRTAINNLSPSDRLLFERFGTGPIEPLPHQTLHAAFETWAATQPAAVAVEHLGRSITYGELNSRAERLAASLYRRGVRRGDAVGLYVQRSIPMVVGMLATLKIGAAYAPQH